MSWINNYQVWLSESQSLKNGQLVADHLVGEGWTPEAISALLGNMRHESSVNPNMYEYGYGWSANRGFGLVQWTPRSKYWDWALANGFSESELRNGNAQLARIDYEVDNNIQWISTPNYPLSFSQFRSATTDNYSIDYLTRAFTWNYERPNLQAGENSMPDRIAFAKKALNNLNFSGGGSGGNGIPDGYQLAVFPMDVIDVSQGEYGSYSHTPARNEQLAMDFMGRDANNNWVTEYPLYAPFDLEIIDIYHEWAQVIWRSTTKVFGVDGTKHDVITISTAHDWNYASKPIGTRIKKGELMGHTGNAGMSTGDHLHIQLFNTNHHPWPSDETQQLHLYNVFDTSNVKLWFRDGGYDWKQWDGSDDPPGGGTDPDPDPPDDPEPEPDPWQALVSRFISDLLDELEEMLTVDVHKQANSDYYKNSFLILQKQLENSYKIKPSFKMFDDLADKIKKFLKDFR